MLRGLFPGLHAIEAGVRKAVKLEHGPPRRFERTFGIAP